MSKKSARRQPATETATGPAANPAAPCPCGLDATYRDCCGSLHDGRTTATTAQRLMRARYSAFVVRDAAYLLRSWHSTTRPSDISFEPAQHWTGLEVLGTTGGSSFHRDGTVEFRAHFTLRGQAHSQHELSRFVREDGHWVYVSALERP
nr:YchJ family metal-binding protein [Streptomyces zagrosensis]